MMYGDSGFCSLSSTKRVIYVGIQENQIANFQEFYIIKNCPVIPTMVIIIDGLMNIDVILRRHIFWRLLHSAFRRWTRVINSLSFVYPAHLHLFITGFQYCTTTCVVYSHGWTRKCEGRVDLWVQPSPINQTCCAVMKRSGAGLSRDR